MSRPAVVVLVVALLAWGSPEASIGAPEALQGLDVGPVVAPPTLPAGVLFEGLSGPQNPSCEARSSFELGSGGPLLPGACRRLGGLIAGCSGLSSGRNWLFEVTYAPLPGECLFLQFNP